MLRARRLLDLFNPCAKQQRIHGPKEIGYHYIQRQITLSTNCQTSTTTSRSQIDQLESISNSENMLHRYVMSTWWNLRSPYEIHHNQISSLTRCNNTGDVHCKFILFLLLSLSRLQIPICIVYLQNTSSMLEACPRLVLSWDQFTYHIARQVSYEYNNWLTCDLLTTLSQPLTLVSMICIIWFWMRHPFVHSRIYSENLLGGGCLCDDDHHSVVINLLIWYIYIGLIIEQNNQQASLFPKWLSVLHRPDFSAF